MNPAALNAFGISLDIVGATLVYFFAFKSAPGSNFVVTSNADPLKNERSEGIGFLGYLALLDGFFVQLIASLENMRLQDIAK